MAPSRSASLSAVVVVLLAACASAPSTTQGTTGGTVPATSTPRTSIPPAGRGWIGGEPDWDSTTAGGGDAGLPTMSATDAAASFGGAEPASERSGDVAAPSPVERSGPLRAGSVDDNADFAAFLTYTNRITDLGIQTRAFDATGRVVVTVTGASGLPVAGAEIIVTAADSAVGGDAPLALLRTTADGTARFLPALYPAATGVAELAFTSAGVTGTADQDGNVSIALDAPGGAPAPVALDVLFLLDATGSMGDEIDQLKTTIDQVAAQVETFETRPDVRFAFTLYRDEGDLFVTSTYDFTGDVDEFRAALTKVVADGGGDYPEALEEGFAAALSEPTWRDPASTVQLMFLVGDAPPRLDRQVATEYPAAIVDAVSRGIKVFPIASSESDDQAEVVFRSIAVATGARFVFLSYGASGAATGDATDIGPTDYEEMSLDGLVVRFIAEELAALTGEDPGVTTPITNPDGQ